MVAVEKLNSEAVTFDSQNFDFESFDTEFENRKIAAEKNLNFAAGKFDMTVVVAYMNFGSDSAIEVVDNLVEVPWTLEYYRWSGFWSIPGYYFSKNLSFDYSFAKKSPTGAVVYDFSENR